MTPTVLPLPVVTGSQTGLWGEIAHAIATGGPMPTLPPRPSAADRVTLKQGSSRIGGFPDVEAARRHVEGLHGTAVVSKDKTQIVGSYTGADGSKHVVFYKIV